MTLISGSVRTNGRYGKGCSFDNYGTRVIVSTINCSFEECSLDGNVSFAFIFDANALEIEFRLEFFMDEPTDKPSKLRVSPAEEMEASRRNQRIVSWY